MPHALFVRTLTEADRRELSRLVRDRDGRVVRRAQIILLSAQGKMVGEIAQFTSYTMAAIRQVVKRFNREGSKGLADRPRSGRPPKVTAKYVRLLKETVAKSPRDFDYIFSSWTLDRLREYLNRRCGILLSKAHLARVMADHQIVYRRPRHAMKHLQDPVEYDEKKALLAFLKKELWPRTPPSNSSSRMSVKFISTRP